MRKITKYFVGGIIVLVLVFVLLSSFVIDVGINSIFFIKRDFNQAFTYRATGDCDSFVNYLSRDTEKWKKTCEEEKSHNAEPIRNFEIQNISHRFGSDRAFLQVELTRNTTEGKDYSYSVNYEMRKFGFDWKIDQEMK
ncbi:MAG: hypothetical protein NT012_00295 [Candidatus Nealsonbacteria bacterium]|nr:hypothetical protein [Candidatus Nealsonbacteria bacterium]